MNTFFRNYIRPRFDRALFREGMRQLRIPGIVFAVWEVLFILIYATGRAYGDSGQKVYTVDESAVYALDEIVSGAAFFSSVFLVGALLLISHFLRSGKARDFYCAAPHSVGTVWLNFALSAFAWNAVGIVAGHLVEMLVLLSADLKLFALCMTALAGNLAFSFLLFGIAALAITLTGRMINALAVGAGLAFLPSMVWYAFHAFLFDYFQDFNFLRFPDGMVCPDPFAVFPYFLDITSTMYSYASVPDGMTLLCTGGTMRFCLCMGAVWLAGAYVFGAVRTGDTVGRAFVNRAAHHVSLAAITLPVALLFLSYLPAMLARRVSPYPEATSDMIIEILIAAVGYAVIYWVAELALTFDWKHAHEAFRYVPVPVAAALAVLGAGYLTASSEFTTTVKPDDVASFSLVRNASLNDDLAIFRLSGTHGRLITDETNFTDKTIIAYASSQISDYVKLYRESPQKALGRTNNYAEEYSFDSGYTTDDGLGDNLSSINLKLTLKNGREITRAVYFDDAHKEQLAKAIQNDAAFMKRFLTLPDSAKLNISMEGHGDLTAEETEAIYNSFVAEYNAMTDEQKFRFLKQNLYSNYEDEIDLDATTAEEPDEQEAEEPVRETADESGASAQENIRLAAASLRVGDYAIEHSDVAYGEGVNNTRTFIIEISGYAYGHLYQRDYRFDESFQIDEKNTPKTFALVVSTHNSHMTELLETLKHTDAKQYVDLMADYFTAKDYWNISYTLITDYNREMAKENVIYYLNGEVYENDDYDSRKPFDGKIVTVDANAMVERLLKDAEATGESVDFTKPYCVLHLYVYGKKTGYTRNGLTVYVQTDFSYEDFVVKDSNAADKKKA